MIVPLAAAQGLVLLARRRLPLAALAATMLMGSFMIAAGYADGPASVGTCCAAYAVALYWSEGGGRGIERHETLRSAQAVLGAAAAFTVASLAPGARGRPTSWGPLTVVLLILAEGLPIASAWVLGYAIRTRRAYIAELKERAARLEAEEGERAARAVADERLRIARELHDVIGHSISLITIQAEAATRSARTNPDMLPGYWPRSRLRAAWHLRRYGTYWPCSGRRPPSGAHGIVGMRERVALYGGSLRTGARPSGGFAVEACIPLPEEVQ